MESSQTLGWNLGKRIDETNDTLSYILSGMLTLVTVLIGIIILAIREGLRMRQETNKLKKILANIVPSDQSTQV